ncbi:MAG: hypothetical protein ACRDGA_10930 [Bacteroidota bacterium]
MQCPNCASSLTETQSFCMKCGMLQKENLSEMLECENHTGQPAVGLCIVCGKPVCGDCALTLEGKIFCDDVQHQKMRDAWSVIVVSDSEFEADMIQRNLAGEGIECRVFSFRDHVGTFWLPDPKPVNALVPIPKKDQALNLLRRLSLVDHPHQE